MHNLDPRETTVRIPSPNPGLHLFLRHLPPADAANPRGIVLYVHGGTFPSALSVAHRFDGRSWRDTLADAGFHVWGLDFHGFGHSDPYPDPDPHIPLGRTADASRQLEHAVRFILDHHGRPRLSLVAHSWGSMVAGHLAGRCPELVDRMVFFGPIARRDTPADPPKLPAWRLISLQDQWDRFTADVPPGEPPGPVPPPLHRLGPGLPRTPTPPAATATRLPSGSPAAPSRTFSTPGPASSPTIPP